MFSLHSLVPLFAFVSLCFSVPAHELINRGRFTLQQTAIQYYSKNPGIEVIRATYTEYGLQPPHLRELESLAEPPV
jgi:hypothetical protein